MNENPFASPDTEVSPEQQVNPNHHLEEAPQSDFYYDAHLYWTTATRGSMMIILFISVFFPSLVFLVVCLQSGLQDALSVMPVTLIIAICISGLVIWKGIMPDYQVYQIIKKQPAIQLSKAGIQYLDKNTLWSDVRSMTQSIDTILIQKRILTGATNHTLELYYLNNATTDDLIVSLEYYSELNLK
jgi:branched-subunit amino acid transport protein